MSQLEIRQAKKGDTNRIVDLLYQLGLKTEPAMIEALISKSFRSIDEICVGVQNGGVIAVMSLIYFDYFPSGDKLCRITSIVVDENIRRSGIGTMMIEYAKASALAEGCSALEVTTSLLREQTQAYYESIGFQKTSYKYVQKLDTDV